MSIANITNGELGSSVRSKLNAVIAAVNNFTNAYLQTNNNANNGIVGVNSAGTLFNTGWKQSVVTGALLYFGTAGTALASTNAFSIGKGNNHDLSVATAFSKTTYGADYLDFDYQGADASYSKVHLQNELINFANFNATTGYAFELDLQAERFLVTSDCPSFAGIQYNADHSANYTARSLVDKGYVTSVTTGFLHLSGGTMTGSIKIPQGTGVDFYNASATTLQSGITYNGNVTYFIAFQASQRLRMDWEYIDVWANVVNIGKTTYLDVNSTAGTMTVGSSTSGFSMKYAADYSPNYTSRSLVDYAYVNSLVSTTSSAYLPLAGGTMTGAIYYSGTPTADSELVNRSYVWDLVNGLDYKEHVAVATTANITLSGVQTIDGVAGAVDFRVLVKNQTTATENGIYLMKSGAWVRATDGDSGVDLEWAVVPVSGGSQSGKLFRCNQTGITLGSTSISFSEWVSGTYYAGSYLSLTGSTFNIDFSTFSTTQITEGTNLYHTTARVRNSITASGGISYNSTTGDISMSAASSSVNGYLTSSDWTAFDAKNNLTQNHIAYGNASNKIVGSADFTFDGTKVSMANGINLIQGAYAGTSIYGSLKNTSGVIRWIDLVADSRDTAKNVFWVESSEASTNGSTTVVAQGRASEVKMGIQSNNSVNSSLFITSLNDATFGFNAGSSVTDISINKSFRPTSTTLNLGSTNRSWLTGYINSIISVGNSGTLLTDVRTMTTEYTLFNFSTGSATGNSNNSFKQVYNFTNDAGTTTYFIGANLRVKNIVTPTAGAQEVGFLFETNYNGTVAERFRINGTGILLPEGHSLVTGTTTGTKICTTTTQKLSFWNATPIVQPTTGVAASTFTANSGTAVNDASTFDGYTMGQVVKALRNVGLLA